ncbi:MAG: hypothetical protein ACK4XJ_09515 [Fimbriimonadaceae bacterium]
MGRKTKFVIAAGVALATFAVASTPVAAQGTTASEFNVKLKDVDLMTALRFLTDQTGLQFVMEPNLEVSQLINIDVTGVTPEEALRYICQSAGVAYRKDHRNVFIIGRASVNAPTTAAELPFITPTQKPKIVRTIQLLRADARYVYKLLNGMDAFDPLGGFVELQKFQQVVGLQAPGQASSGSLVPTIGSPEYTTPVDTARTINRPNAGREGLDIALPHEVAGQGIPGGGGRGGGMGGGFGGGQGGPGGGLGGGFGGGQGGAGGGLGGGNQLAPADNNFIPQGTDTITYDPSNNTLIFKGTEEAFAQLQSNIANFFDKAPAQVEVKVEFITTKSGLADSLGIDWLYSRGTMNFGATPGLFANAGDPIFFNYATGNVTSRLRASLNSGNSRIVTSPILRTLNNQPAVVAQQTEIAIPIDQVISTGNGQLVRARQLVAFPVTTGLAVTPRINFGDRTVTMFLSPQIQNISTQTDQTGATIPTRTAQFVSVVARVSDMETIVLGGLVNKSDIRNVNKFPILADLPIIGQFFQSRSRTIDNTELLIFVTPRIIEDETTGFDRP